MKSLARGFLDLALPPLCAGCSAPIDRKVEPFEETSSIPEVLCAACVVQLDVLSPGRCIRCQTLLPEPCGEGDIACAACSNTRSPLSSCLASVVYRDSGESWIRRFKYPEPGLAILRHEPESVATAMIVDAAARTPGPRPQLVIPIPLHTRRLRERGFNPSAVLAREVARRMGVAFSSRHLIRTRDTPSQTRLSRRERRRNLHGAFSLGPAGALPRRIWLVDDVVTTGSTLLEAARTLAARENIEVHAICAARAAGPGESRDPPRSSRAGY